MPGLFFICFILILFLIIGIRTFKFKPEARRTAVGYKESEELTGPNKLAKAIQVQTISRIEGDKTNGAALKEFHEMLEREFPLVHKYCEKTVINEYSLIYRLKAGETDSLENTASLKKPILITSHMDVVPVEEGTKEHWKQPPFSGNIKDGIVWGRGTLDTKAHLIAALEAVERLLYKGFSPARDIYLAFGHDEEVGGMDGALKIAEYFKEKKLEFDFVLDEGGCVATNVIAGINKPLALVGVGEKGYADIRLTVTKSGGHSSMPAPHTSLGILAKAICLLERHPFKPKLIPPTRNFLLRIGPYMNGLNRMVLANLWIFKPLFFKVFSKMNSGSALLRTSTAVTMVQGSPAANVIPQKSWAVVNFRILPGENQDTVLNHIKEVLKGLPVEVEPLTMRNPSALSPSDSKEFQFISDLIGEFCGEVIVTPYLVMAGTDARKYELVCKNIFRFTPYVIDNEDVGKIHSTNENISVVNVNRCIDFFMALMERV